MYVIYLLYTKHNILKIEIGICIYYSFAILYVIVVYVTFRFVVQGIATGKYHAAILTNNEDWELKAIEAGRNSGDLLAPLVYCPELHFSEFASSVADMKNSVAVNIFFRINTNRKFPFFAEFFVFVISFSSIQMLYCSQ